MNDLTDQKLLRDYSGSRLEPAFAELVRRHVDHIYSAALRMLHDAHLAEDVTQNVFLALAQNAGRLASHPVLSGWLHRTTINLAANALRSNTRRRAREQEAVAMHDLLSADPDTAWEHIAPQLDAALNELSEADRDALFLRYFERKSAREMARTLGVTDDAAQKRLNRAVDRLRESFSRRGVTVGASGLVVVLSANAVQAAPAGLAVTISAAAALVGTTLITTATATASKAIAMTTLQKILVTATVGVLAGAGVYEARQASALREEAQSLRQAQATLVEQVAQLKAENERLSNHPKPAGGLSPEQLNELLRLRGRAGASARELADVKAALAQQPGQVPEILTREMNSFLAAITNQGRQVYTNTALRRTRQLSAKANLSGDQQQVVRDILLANVEPRTGLEVARVSGDLTLDEIMKRKDQIDADEEQLLSGVLTPGQLADYQQVKADEVKADNVAWINSEAAWMKRTMKLNDQQAEQVNTILSGLKPGEGGPGITYYSNARDQLETRLRAFQPVLNPEQLSMYREAKMDDIVEHEKVPAIIQALKK